MGGYVANFMVYTMAMTGLICFAVFVYKKIMDGSLGKKRTNCIEIEDTMNLNPRKTLQVIRVGNEKFLIASDIDRTTLISKLNSGRPDMNCIEDYQNSNQTFRNTMEFVERQERRQAAPAPESKRVHLEPITRRGIGISNIRHSMDTRAGNPVQMPVKQPVQQKPVVRMPVRQKQVQMPVQPSVRNPQPAAPKSAPAAKSISTGSPMKDMAKKINEL